MSPVLGEVLHPGHSCPHRLVTLPPVLGVQGRPHHLEVIIVIVIVIIIVTTLRYSGKLGLALTGPEEATAPCTRCGYFSLNKV